MYSPRASLRLKQTAQQTLRARCAYATTPYGAPAPHPSSLTDEDVNSARSYCSNLTQKFDYSSYILHTFIPQHSRDAYFAIRALNIELARIPDVVSSPMVGAMRMQFWRDNVQRTFARTPPREPVAILLHQALETLKQRHPDAPTSSLKSWFMKIVNAREQYMDNRAYANMDALEAYAEATYSTLMYLVLGFLPLHSMPVDHLASHIGKAEGIAAVLRGMPLIASPSPPNHHSASAGGSSQGSIILPLDVMARYDCKQEDIFRQGADAPGLKDVVFEVATRANDHLITASSMLKNLQRGEDMGHDFEHEGEEGHEYTMQAPESGGYDLQRGFGALMPAVPTRLWLQKLEKVDFDIFKPQVRARSLKLPWSAYWAFNRKQI